MEKDGPHNKISLCNTKIKGVKAFDTGDLIERHPRKKDLWRVYGRVEDQIVLQSGLQTNPLPIGMSLRFCSYLALHHHSGTYESTGISRNDDQSKSLCQILRHVWEQQALRWGVD
jgi:hypothetical protein